MKVLIIEDEQPAVQRLVRMLKDIDQHIEVTGILESVERASNWLIENPHPELIFMDVQLEDGLCFEIFEHIDIHIPVIFTTAFHQYTLQAFKVNSVDYLLKPVHIDELKNALDKFQLVHHKGAAYSRIENLLSELQPRTKERFFIKVGEHYKSVLTTDINCFFIKERCNFISIGKGKNYAIDYSLDKAETMIDKNRFFRANRNIIINFYAIQDIIAYSSNRLKIKLENWHESDEILVSRERVAAFKKWMDR